MTITQSHMFFSARSLGPHVTDVVEGSKALRVLLGKSGSSILKNVEGTSF